MASALAIAAGCGELERCQNILNSGIDVDEDVDEDGNSMLYEACSYGQITIINFLLDNNANINKQNHRGWTPLHRACDRGFPTVTELLLERGADCELQTTDGQQAIDFAVPPIKNCIIAHQNRFDIKEPEYD